MKRKGLTKTFMAGALILAATLTVGALAPASVQAKARPGKAAVQNVEASAAEDEDSVSLEYTWNKVGGAKGYQYRYNLFWTKESKAKDFTKGLTKKTTVQVGLQDNDAVCFQVRAYKLDKGGKKVFGKWSSKKVLEKDEIETMLGQTSNEGYDFSEAHKKDLEIYASVFSGLKDGQYYAFADINAEFDALLVTDYVYDNPDGGKAAIGATVYGFNKDGEIVEYGTVESSGTAYPLAVNDGCLYCCGGHYVTKYFADKETASMAIKEAAGEDYDSDGTATYYYIGEDGSKQEQKDDGEQKRLLAELENTLVVNFFPVNK